jgi:hypothetical protein
VQGERRVIHCSPGFSATTKREGAPMVPPTPTSSSFPVPAACTTRRRAFHTPPHVFFFLMPPRGLSSCHVDNKAA